MFFLHFSTHRSVPMAKGSGQMLGMLRSSWLVALSWLSSMPQRRLLSNVVCWSSVSRCHGGGPMDHLTRADPMGLHLGWFCWDFCGISWAPPWYHGPCHDHAIQLSHLGNCCLQRALDCGDALVPDCAERWRNDVIACSWCQTFEAVRLVPGRSRNRCGFPLKVLSIWCRPAVRDSSTVPASHFGHMLHFHAFPSLGYFGTTDIDDTDWHSINSRSSKSSNDQCRACLNLRRSSRWCHQLWWWHCHQPDLAGHGVAWEDFPTGNVERT